MEPSEAQNRDKEQPGYTDHHQTGKTDKENCFIVASFTEKKKHRQVPRIRDKAVQAPQVILVVQDIHEAQGEHANHVNGERQQKQEEVAIVPPPDAVVHPRTVMVKVLGRKT